MSKIRTGDQVIVIAGRDKGRTGSVKKIHKDGFKIVVEGVNLVKRHTRGNPQKQIPGGIVEKEAPLHISNVAIFNSATGKADRVGFKIIGEQKQRIYKSTDEVIVSEKGGK